MSCLLYLSLQYYWNQIDISLEVALSAVIGYYCTTDIDSGVSLLSCLRPDLRHFRYQFGKPFVSSPILEPSPDLRHFRYQFGKPFVSSPILEPSRLLDVSLWQSKFPKHLVVIVTALFRTCSGWKCSSPWTQICHILYIAYAVIRGVERAVLGRSWESS